MEKHMKEILRIAQINHSFLVKKLTSKQGKELPGKWVAVAKNKIYSSNLRNEALKRIKTIESRRERVLLVHIPKQRHNSISF